MDLSYKNIKEVFVSIIVGFCIGLSVIVPGISGSTIAIVMKVYDKMMYAFSNVFKKFKSCIIFLIPILIGIVVGFALGFLLVRLLLDAYPFITICLFVGLMIGTYPIVLEEVKGSKPMLYQKGLFVIGLIIPLLMSVLSLVLTGSRDLTNISIMHYIMFLCIGILISLTQLIPGLSATVLLMIFGYYKFLLDEVSIDLLHNFDLLLVYVVIVIGFVIGTLMFSKIINNLLNKQRKSFFFVICGLSLGSMISVFIGQECLDIYKSWDNNSILIEIILGLISLTIGTLLTYIVYRYSKNKRLKEQQQE